MIATPMQSTTRQVLERHLSFLEGERDKHLAILRRPGCALNGTTASLAATLSQITAVHLALSGD